MADALLAARRKIKLSRAVAVVTDLPLDALQRKMLGSSAAKRFMFDVETSVFLELFVSEFAVSNLGPSTSLQVRLHGLIAPIVAAAGLDLVSLRAVVATGLIRLELAIDRLPGEGAIALGDCARMSRRISAVLESDGAIAAVAELKLPCELEVSSPGMNRELRNTADFIRYMGVTAKVTVRDAGSSSGKLVLLGAITASDATSLTLQISKTKVQTLALSDIVKAQLSPTLNEWQKIGQRLKVETADRPLRPIDNDVDDLDDDGAESDDLVDEFGYANSEDDA